MHLSAALELAGPAAKDHADLGANASKRRGAARRTLRLKALTNTPSAGSAQVVVHDISTVGMLIESACGVLSKDDFLKISLPEEAEVDARVVWQSGRFSGCQFAGPVPVSVVSAALLKGEPEPSGDVVEAAGQPAYFSTGAPLFEPKLNFRTAFMLSFMLWALLGAAVLLIVS